MTKRRSKTMTRNPLETVGVQAGDSEDTLKKAYRARAIECHPDHGGSVEAMSELNEAYQWLAERLNNGRVPSVTLASPVRFVFVFPKPAHYHMPTTSATTFATGGSWIGWPW
jgi:hypothetical protein